MLDGGGKANTVKEIDDAKSRLRMRDIVEVPNRERLSKDTVLSVKYKKRTDENGYSNN